MMSARPSSLGKEGERTRAGERPARRARTKEGFALDLDLTVELEGRNEVDVVLSILLCDGLG